MSRNKPRHKFKQDGYRTSDFCNHCMCHDCNSWFSVDTIAVNKRTQRRRDKVCEGCGKDPCKCKNRKGY